jgi:hypothetical protein
MQMKWLNKNTLIKIAKFIKVPSSDVINKRLYFEPIQSFISGRQTIYKLQSKNNTVIFYRKNNLNVFGKVKSAPQDVFVLPLSHKGDIIIYERRYDLRPLSTAAFRFVGVDHELYEVIYEDIRNRRITIRRFTNGDIVLDLDFQGQVEVAIPLYNNYVPIALVTDKCLKVFIYNLIDRQLLEIAEYSLDFLGEEMFKYLDSIKGYRSGHETSIYRLQEEEAINQLLAKYKMSYRVKRPDSRGKRDAEDAYEICSNFVICKSFLHVTNVDLHGAKVKGSNPIFVLGFGVVGDVIECELSIPKGVSMGALGLSKTPRKHVIDTRQLKIKLPNYDYKIPCMLYHDKSYAIVPSFFDTNKYFIVSNDGSSKYTMRVNYTEEVFTGYVRITTHYNLYVYVSGEFIFFVYKDRRKNRYGNEIFYKILIYNNVRKYWIEYLEYVDNIFGFCYIQKCKKFVLFQGQPLSRMGFDLEQFVIIDLAGIDKDNTINKNDFVLGYGYHIDYISKSEIRNYIKDNHKEECSDLHAYTNDVIRCDFTIDNQRGIIYIMCTIKHENCAIKFIALEFDLCNEYRFRDLDVGFSVMITDNMLNKNVSIFIPGKPLRYKGMSKYLSAYISKDFYDFLRNKSFDSDLIFSSFSSKGGIWTRDKYFNRFSIVLKSFDSLRNIAHVFLSDDMVLLEGDGEKTAGVFIVSGLAIVKHAMFYDVDRSTFES